jgi:hypothetical protein
MSSVIRNCTPPKGLPDVHSKRIHLTRCSSMADFIFLEHRGRKPKQIFVVEYQRLEQSSGLDF